MIKIINSFIVALLIISYGCNQSASKKVNQEKAAAASESSPITAAMTRSEEHTSELQSHS